MAARPERRRHLAILAGLAIAGIAAACTPVTSPPPPPPSPPPPAPAPQPTESVASACPGADAPARNDNVPTDYVAVVDDGDGASEIESFTAGSQAELDAEVAALATEGEVRSVEPDLPVHALAVSPGDDPSYGQQYGLHNAGFDAAWALPGGYDGDGQVIAIVDTGIDAAHPEFTGRVLPGQRFLGGTGAPQGNDVTDGHSHGTHVSGIAAAADNTIYGLGGAPSAQILPVKVLNDSGSGSSSDVAAGVAWAAQNGATIINLSLGGGSCAVMQEKIDEALAAGVEVVAAAGNSNSNKLSAPGGNAGVIAVGATTASNAKASYSNYGPYVDLAAPGDGILSTVPGGFGTKSGTSMASPFVAAAVALLQQACGSMSPSSVLTALQTYAGPTVSGLEAKLLDVDNTIANTC